MAIFREEAILVQEDAAARWQARIRIALERSVEFYNSHPLAMELILGPGGSPDIRAADRKNVVKLAEPMLEHIGRYLAGFDPDEMKLRLELALDIVDAMLSHSYHLHGEITPFFLEEAHRAVVSYLELYIGRHLVP